MDIPKGPTDGQKIDQAKADLQTQLSADLSSDAHNSLLRKAIDFVTEPYHHRQPTEAGLTQARNQMDLNGLSPAQKEAIADKAIKQDQSSRQEELDSYRILSGAAKAFGTFIPGKLGYLAAGTIYALDQPTNTGATGTDAAFAFAKGILMRAAVSNIAKGETNPALMSLKLGAASRVIDTSVSRTNYLDAISGDFTARSFGMGLLRTGENAVNPIALGTDVLTAGLAHGALKLAPEQIAGNTFRRLTTLAFTRGYANGLAEEAGNEYHDKKLDLGRLAVYPLATALSTSIAAAPGNQRSYVRNWPLENAANIRDLDYKLVSIAPQAVKEINSGGGQAVETTVQTVGDRRVLSDPETMNIAKAKVPVDWIGLATERLNLKGRSAPADGGDQLRFVSRAKGDESAPWQMVTTRGLPTINQLIARQSDYYQGGKVAPYLKDFREPVSRYLSSGSESGAFMLANGAVLKIASSLSADRFANWGKLPYDARAMFPPTTVGEASARYGLKEPTSILLQEPLRTPVTEAQAATLRDDMARAGVSFHDYNQHLMGEQVSWAVDQAGTDATGKTVMLDYGARYSYRPLTQNQSETPTEATAETSAPPQKKP